MKQVKTQSSWSAGLVGCFALGMAFGVAGCSDASPKEPNGVGTTEQNLNGYNYSDNRAWSQSPPNGLTVSQVPQFVELGFDDNFISGLGSTTGGMTWILNFLRAKRNPAGSGNSATFDNALIRANFYSNTCYISGECGSPDTSPTNIKESWRTAIVDGHETGSHTHTHPHGGAFSVAQWNAEIDPNVDWLTRAYVANALPGPGSGPGLANANLEGFRAPFLEFNSTLFSELKNNGFTYDVSIEEGWQLSADGLNYNWPFTLNSGSPSFTTGNVTGLWELGAAPFLRPSCSPYPCSPVSTASRTTGLDYNMFYSASMTQQQALDALKYTLDQRLAGNRAPFLVGAHSAIYSEQQVEAPATNAAQRRQVIEDFINYALTKPQVRIVTAKNIITWMRNPVALGGGCTPETDAAFCSRLGKNCGTVTANDNCGTSRTVTSCGSCTSPATCGGGGTANVCGSASSGDKTEGGTATGTGTACNTTTETVAKAYDNLMTSSNFTKWCVTSAPSTSTPVSTMYDFSGSTAFAITSYTITTGNDVPARDPKNWTFQGCQGTCTVGSGTGWVTLDTRTNQFAGAARFQTNTYTFTNSTAYQQYRLRMTANNGDTGRTQITEIQMFAGTCTPETDAAFCSRLGKNCGSVTANDNCGTSRTVSSCGTCTSPATCGGGGTANVCGGGTCTPETNAAFCSRLGKNCGSVTANDNCGTSRTVNPCGTCTSPQTCGGGGTANVCGGGGGSTCAPAYSVNNCLAYAAGQQVSNVGHNWTCANDNCRNCATHTECAPGGTGCPWGVVWTDNGTCQ